MYKVDGLSARGIRILVCISFTLFFFLLLIMLVDPQKV